MLKSLLLLACFLIYTTSFDGVIPAGNYSELVQGVDGTMFLVPVNDLAISSTIRMFGHYEKPARDIVLNFIKEGSVVYDLGANIGTWTVPLARYVGPTGRVYSFEVLHQAYSYLVANTVLNGLINVDAKMLAVGNTREPVLIPVHNRDDKSSPMKNLGGFSLRVYDLRRHVNDSYVLNEAKANSVILDDFINTSDFKCPSLIKMDVELYELYVLQGAKDLLKKCMPVLYIEMTCGALSRSIITLLHYSGYSMAWVVATPISDAENHLGRTYKSVDPRVILELGTGSINLIALPKERKAELLNKAGVVPIHPELGLFLARDYNIQMCVDGYCGVYQQMEKGHEKDEVYLATHCSDVKLPVEDVEYWKEVEKIYKKDNIDELQNN